MTTPILPEAVKFHRDRKRWTQEDLAEATKGRNKVSLPTIKRIESTKGDTYPAQDRIAEALSKALGVSVDDLTKAPSPEQDHEEALRKFGYRPLRTMIDAETTLAFNTVQHIYGISIRSQIEMAPLFAALLAEGSFAWRRNRVTEIEDAAANLMALGSGHFSFANSAYRAEDGAAAERDSIAKRDLFGKSAPDEAYDLGFDPSENNPFADYLAQFAREVDAKAVTFDKSLGWKTAEGLPSYQIGADIIAELTGDDPDAEYALLRGHVRFKDVPKDLLGSENLPERIDWMIDRIPEGERAERQAEQERLSSLLGDLDLPNDADGATSVAPTVSKGGADA